MIEKVNTMMTKLKSPIMSAELRMSTPLRPIKYVVTRWLSIMDMFDRYLNIKEFSDNMPKTVPFMLSPSENQRLNELSLLLKPIKSVTVAMQKPDLDLASTRTFLDELFKCVPNLDSNKKYIYPNASIIKNKDFENRIVKVSNGRDDCLSVHENIAMKKLRKTVELTESEVENIDPEIDFATNILKRQKLKIVGKSSFVNVEFVPSTSCKLERLFSMAGFMYDDNRKSLLPANQEEQMFLKFHENIWNLELVNDIVNAHE